MTLTEFSNEFDVVYNNISNNSAPGVNEYEKSVFLTRAQELLIKEVYSGNSVNNFDSSEDVRSYFNNLITSIVKDSTLSENTRLGNIHFKLDKQDKVLFILTMQLYTDRFKSVPVAPISYDEYNVTKQNPFKRNKNRALSFNSSEQVDVIYDNEFSEGYPKLHITYIKKPKPIILETLSGVCIDGKSEKSECELPDSIHYDIIIKAVQLALTANSVTES